MINWGIIGCGDVTEVKSGPAFNKVDNSKLIAVMRRNASLARDYARRHNVPKYYSNADELINDPGINAIYVATPPGSHKEYALRALKAGKPVYIEKPMAPSYSDCLEINTLSEELKIPVFVAYYRRALPGFLKVRDLVTTGQIGNVRLVQMQLFKSPSNEERSGKLGWRVDPEVAGGGHFFDLASHQLDYLDFLFGPVERVKSIVLNQGGLYKAEDYVSAEFTFPGNIAGTGIWCFNASPESDRDIIEIVGEHGTISFSCFSFEPIVLINKEGRQQFINERPEHVQYYLIEQVVKALSGNGEAVSTGRSAARTSRILDEVVNEYYGGKKLL